MDHIQCFPHIYFTLAGHLREIGMLHIDHQFSNQKWQLLLARHHSDSVYLSTVYKAPNFWISQLLTSMKMLRMKIAFFLSVGVSPSQFIVLCRTYTISPIGFKAQGSSWVLVRNPPLLWVSGTNLFFCPSTCFVSSFSWLYHPLFLCLCLPFVLPMPLST